MNKNNVKYIFLCILMMILIVFLLYSAFKMFFSNGYVISINNKNRQEISEMLEKQRIENQNITRLEIEMMLGDAELRAYRNFKLCDIKRVSESSEIVWYILDEGTSIGIKYIFYILVTVILIATNKEWLDRLNSKNEDGGKK